MEITPCFAFGFLTLHASRRRFVIPGLGVKVDAFAKCAVHTALSNKLPPQPRALGLRSKGSIESRMFKGVMEADPVNHEVGNMVAQQVRDSVVPCVICGFHSDESMARFGLEWMARVHLPNLQNRQCHRYLISISVGFLPTSCIPKCFWDQLWILDGDPV